MSRKSMFALLGSSLAFLIFTAAPAARAPQTDGYVGADGCKTCHAAHFTAWAATKHQRTFSRLGANDKVGDKCIRCHVTGTPEMIKVDGAAPRYPGVQCEMCHGGGALHVEQAKGKAIVKGAIVKTPDEENCLKCHTDASPHYKPFFYAAMKGLVHTIKK